MSDLTAPRAGFFRAVFGQVRGGYICIATMKPGTRNLREMYFAWPDQINEMLEHVEEASHGLNVYFCPQLVVDPNFRLPGGKSARVKENIEICTTAWADLDSCHPDNLLLKPSIVSETSPSRYQALWVFADPLEASIAEDISRRIAYYHVPDGADKSGWDLTQLLRAPFTENMKYGGSPVVNATVMPARYRQEDFKLYPGASKRTGGGIPIPEPEDVPDIENPIDFIQERRRNINPGAFRLFTDEPEANSWSEPLWKLMMLLFEGGCSREEVFAIARKAACNKYERDGRPERHLWDDVCRAYIKHM